ncbi:FtsH protease activity modulator HflK [soil metagenome]
MAWNQPGKGKQNPWGTRGPGGGLGGGLGGIGQRLRDQFSGGGGNPLGWLLPVLALLLVFNSFKLVDERQRGVVLRFGQFNRILTPGANFKWPWPVEVVTMIDATKIEQLDDQVRVLTKDENIVDIRFNAQYQVSDPRLFLFGFRDDLSVDGKFSQGRETLQNAAESAVREVVGNNTMDTVLFERSRLIVAAKLHLQESLDLYKTGLKVTEFTLQNARPPEEVKRAFDDAISAREDKNRIESEAQAYASKIVPEARGAAQRIKAQSEGYRAATIAKAEGDAQRFTLLVGQYRKAPEITRKRLYLETMQQVLSANQKVIASRNNNVFYLPLQGTGTAGSAPPVSQLAPVQAAQAAAAAGTAADDARAPRGDGRPEGR